MTKQVACGVLDGVEYVKISGVSQLDVNKIFDCGQCFRFDPVKESSHEVEFCGVAFGRFVSFAQDGDMLYVYNTDEREFEEIWSRFLALDVDYAAIAEDIAARSDNPALHRAIEYGEGIRILRQDPWETVCSFIISQNNNIPRIKKI
ncbi:MAG: 8-oxoguanine DNA glycosylase, N-terminal domain-containing protein, partial [Clostridia bacterium]|nr:8-oxoguanine DNA glycosylase, N-terminal domain-containing protein [Clostridia bacterium]